VTRFAVIDTNVVVSGLLSAPADSPTGRIVDAMLAATVPFVLSEALLAEYRDVLLRPAIMECHGLTEAQIDTVLEELVLNAGFREPASLERLTGQMGPTSASAVGEKAQHAPPGDEHLIALLESAPGAVLVTGNRGLAQAVASWCAVATPAEFAATLVAGAGG
jgi:predicted nucleic acid-binding protein